MMVQQIIKKQSAFSLIESLITLLILSYSVVAINKLMLVSAVNDQISERREKLVIMARSIANSLSCKSSDEEVILETQYWQRKIKQIAPDCVLKIVRERVEGKWVFTIRIVSEGEKIYSIELQVIV